MIFIYILILVYIIQNERLEDGTKMAILTISSAIIVIYAIGVLMNRG